MSFKDRLKSLRKERGLTQQKLANLLHVSQNAVYNWENGIREPNIDTIQQIAKFLECDISELFEPIASKTDIIDRMVFEGGSDIVDEARFISKFKKFCELLSLGNVQWTETEKNGVAGLEFSFGEKDDDKYFLTKEQTILLPEVTIEQAKALIRSLDRQNREQGS